MSNTVCTRIQKKFNGKTVSTRIQQRIIGNTVDITVDRIKAQAIQ